MTPTIDAERAGRWAGRLAHPGPTADRAELQRLVDDLRAAGERALPHARRAGGFGDALPADVPGAQVLVVDRPGWARLAAGSFSALLAGQQPAVAESGSGGGPASWPVTAEIAGLLAALSSRVLGQFDPYGTDDAGGRLALVAPNILQVGRSMGADLADFGLWICVHEQTHALQFAAAPWLTGHVRSELAALQAELDDTGELRAVVEALRSRAARPAGTGADDGLGPLGALLPAEQRARAARLVATMSLLEGHADVTMDDLPPGAVPSARTLRARMNARRMTGQGTPLRRLLGIDAKLDQYRRGADFVRAVRRADRDALDVVWSGPQVLPSPDEIDAPERWLARTSTP